MLPFDDPSVALVTQHQNFFREPGIQERNSLQSHTVDSEPIVVLPAAAAFAVRPSGAANSSVDAAAFVAASSD